MFNKIYKISSYTVDLIQHGLIINLILEHFSIECRKTKTKVITMANQNKGKFHKKPMRTQSKYV